MMNDADMSNFYTETLMFRYFRDRFDEYLLERFLRQQEQADVLLPQPALFNRVRVLRQVVTELRHPTGGHAAMTPGQVLALIAMILELITQLQGVVAEVVKRVREIRQA
jgi:hypothetical protein